eukprot:8911489-Karenia_brevis.AAC.1
MAMWWLAIYWLVAITGRFRVIWRSYEGHVGVMEKSISRQYTISGVLRMLHLELQAVPAGQ